MSGNALRYVPSARPRVVAVTKTTLGYVRICPLITFNIVSAEEITPGTLNSVPRGANSLYHEKMKLPYLENAKEEGANRARMREVTPLAHAPKINTDLVRICGLIFYSICLQLSTLSFVFRCFYT